MRSHPLVVACIFALFAAPANAAVPVSAGHPRVAVVEALDLPLDAAQFHEKARTTLEAAVSQRSLDLVRLAHETSCATDTCLKEVAAASGATEVLAVTGGPSEYRGYRIDVELWQASNGEAEHASAVCNFCDGQQMLVQIQNGVGPMLDRLVRRATMTTVAPSSVPAAVPPPSAVPMVPLGAPPGVAAPAGTPATRAPLAAIGLTAGGTVIAGIGVALLVADGRCSQSSCDPSVPHQVYDTEKIGLPLTIVGGVAALAGAGWWIYEGMNPHKVPAVSVGPAGFSIAGRY